MPNISKIDNGVATAIGQNTLQGTVKRLCTSIGLTGKRTNHSLRSSSATRLYNACIEEKRVAETTGNINIIIVCLSFIRFHKIS